MSKKENCNRHSFANYDDDDDDTAASPTCHVVAHCTCKYTMDTQEQAHSFCTQFKSRLSVAFYKASTGPRY